MKKVKFLSIVLAILTIFLFSGCNSDDREYYIEQLEDLDREDLVALNSWLDDNEENLGALFEFVNVRVDRNGNELDFVTQVLPLDNDYFDSWSFEINNNTITFTYIWDYERATAVPEEKEIPEEVGRQLTIDNEWLANWIGEDVIPQFEEINVENPLSFTATTGGFISGIRSTLNDLNASEYLVVQIDHIVSFIEDVQSLVVENVDNETLDLVEIRDTIIETLNEMRDLLSGSE